MKRLTLFFILLFAACSKDNGDDTDDNNPPPTPVDISSSRIKACYRLGTDTTTYTYDNKGRLKSSTNTKSGSSVNDYTDTSLTEKYYNLDGTLRASVLYTLNADGSAKLAQGDIGSKTEYSYTTDGMVLEEKMTYGPNSATYRHHYNEGNETFWATVLSNGAEEVQWNFEYYADKPNSLGNQHFGMLHFGKSGKNLLKKVTSGSGSLTSNYTYEFDTKNRVTKRTVTQGTHNDVTIYVWYE